jgi:PleD family two-component response regulator
VEETAMQFTDISPVHITVRLGVCAHEPGDDERELISRAERALDAAKAHGRNRV